MSEVPEARSYQTTDAHISYRDLGSGPPLLLLHGAAPGETGWESFAACIEVLRSRFRLIVVDHPGFGRSRLIEDSGLPYNAISAKAMAELLRHLSIEQAHVAGNSLGGGVALRMALEYPDLVDRIVLIAPFVRGFCPQLLPPPSEGAALLRDYYPDPSPDKMRHMLTRLVADVSTIPDLDTAIASRYEDTLRPEIEATSQRLATGGWLEDYERRSPAQWISTITNLTLMLWGRDDRFCSTDDAFHYLSALRRSELIVFPETGHWVQQERSTEFASYVSAFLARGLDSGTRTPDASRRGGQTLSAPDPARQQDRRAPATRLNLEEGEPKAPQPSRPTVPATDDAEHPVPGTPVASPSAGLPNVVVVDAGGTITATAPDRISYLRYAESLRGGITDVLTRMYPELGGVANVSVVPTDISGLSSDSTTASRYNLSRTVDACLAHPEVVGVVVNGGTNILEEDAYFLDLTVQSDKPVVVTGAMHQSGTFTEDGLTNLFSAIRLAASERTTGFGTVVLMNDQIFAAREVTKVDGYRLDAFSAGSYGALGVVNESRIRLMRAPGRVMRCGASSWRTPFDLSKKTVAELVPVEVVSGYLGSSAVPIQALAAAGVKGIVTSGHGPGSVSAAQSAAIVTAMAEGVRFVSATRTGGEGRYEDGSPGVIGAADLTPQKARLLLQLCMTFSGSEPQVREWFTTIGDPQFDLRPKTERPWDSSPGGLSPGP